ncbi:MAG: hypothetical protein R2706_13200 [Acidimicrobiales bacterium]
MLTLDDGFPEQVPSHWAVSFAVSDTDAAVERAVARGATLKIMPPSDSPMALWQAWSTRGRGFNIIARHITPSKLRSGHLYAHFWAYSPQLRPERRDCHTPSSS